LNKKVQMPAWFKEDSNKQAIATAVIEPYKGKTNTVAIIDTSTGVGEIIAKQEPLSLMGFVNEKKIYAKAGYSTNAETQVTFGVKWNFARVGGVEIGVFGEGRAAFGQKETGSRYPVEAVAGVIGEFNFKFKD
jgi:hypothetical protein